MRFRKRLLNIEKLLPAEKHANGQQQELVNEWLIEYSEEFRECVRQLFRLQCKAGQIINDWEQWTEPFREQASIYIIRMNELIEQHTGSFSA